MHAFKSPPDDGPAAPKTPPASGQRGVVALFDNPSVLHHPDVVPVGQPSLMGDQQRGLLTGGVSGACMTSLFAMGVKAGGRFIQQQQAARHQQRAGDRAAPGLPTDARLIATAVWILRQQGDKPADPALSSAGLLCFALRATPAARFPAAWRQATADSVLPSSAGGASSASSSRSSTPLTISDPS